MINLNQSKSDLGLKTIISGSVAYGGVSAVAAGAMFVCHLLWGRQLGVEDYGRLSTTFAIAMFFIPIMDPGFYYLIIRETARDPSLTARLLGHVLSWKLFSAPFFLLFCVISVLMIEDLNEILFVASILCVAIVFQICTEAIRPSLLGNERFGLAGIPTMAGALAMMCSSVVVVLTDSGLVAIAYSFLGVKVMEFATSYVVHQRALGGPSFAFETTFMRSILVSSIPIGAYYLTLNLYNYIDVIMIAALRDQAEVGWYAASYKLYEGPALVPAVIASVFLPTLSRVSKSDIKKFAQTLEAGVRILFSLAAVVFLNCVFFADLLINLTYGEAYNPSVQSMQVLFSGIFFLFLAHYLQTVLISMDRQRLLLKVAIGGLALNVIFNAILIPLFGYIGAAVATVTVEGFVLVLLIASINKTVSQRPVIIWLGQMIMVISVVLGVLSIITAEWSLVSRMFVLNAGLLSVLGADFIRSGWLREFINERG